MRTTLIIPDRLMVELKQRAAERGVTLSAVVAEVVRRGLDAPLEGAVDELPVHELGRPKINVADRDALYRAMEGR